MNLVMVVHDTVTAIDAKLSKHISDETTDLAANIQRLLADAFPAGDATGHRRTHEADIQRIEDSAAFWKTMRFEISRYGLLGFLGWAGYKLWASFLQGPT